MQLYENHQVKTQQSIKMIIKNEFALLALTTTSWLVLSISLTRLFLLLQVIFATFKMSFSVSCSSLSHCGTKKYGYKNT